MKRIIHIARNELYSLFYSPIAWLLMILFVVLTSADYIRQADSFIGAFQRGVFAGNLTTLITADYPDGIFYGVVRNLYIFLPLLTMGLISREKNNGTMQLLLSSPVRVREIVLGKFLAITCFTICLLILVCLTLIAMCIGLVQPDYGGMLGSLAGLFIILSAYAAIGLFVSSLTTYQVVAAIVTFAIFFILSKAGELWQDIPIVRAITYYLNMLNKSANLMGGLINLRDVCYFLIVITVSLAFSMIRIKSAMQSIPWWKKISRYVIVVAIAFVVGYITKNPYINRYWDTTRYEIHTITTQTQDLLAKLDDGDLEITGVSNLFAAKVPDWSPAGQNSLIDDIWEPYIRFKHNINFKFVYYYALDTAVDYRYTSKTPNSLKQIAAAEAKAYRTTVDHFLSPQDVNRLLNINVAREENRSFFILKYKGRTAILRTFNDMQYWPGEDQIAAAINQLIVPPAKLAFLDDEIERGPFAWRPRDYKMLIQDIPNRHSMVNSGFVSDSISLHQKDIPDSLAALVIADPRTPIAPESLEKIRKYIDAGGNLYLLTEPDRKEITKPLLDMLGLYLHDGLLVQSNDDFSGDLSFPYLTEAGKNIAPQMTKIVNDGIRDRGEPYFRIAAPGASVLGYREKNGFQVTPLWQTIPGISWNRLAPISNDSLQMKVRKMPSDEEGSFVTAVRMNRTINGKQQRIIVTSDADWMTMKSFLSLSKPLRYNLQFLPWCLSYFSYREYPANIMRRSPPDNKFTVTVRSIPPQKIIFYWIIPALMGVIATVLLIRRKRK